VLTLTPDNFAKLVEKSKQVSIVEFYAPWCGHCKNLTPEWKKAATALKGIAKVGAVDAEKHAALGSKYGVQGFPTIKIFVGGKAVEYKGGRTAKDIVAGVHDEIAKAAKARM
jgi:protein disulfide-isomerase A6